MLSTNQEFAYANEIN